MKIFSGLQEKNVQKDRFFTPWPNRRLCVEELSSTFAFFAALRGVAFKLTAAWLFAW